MLRRSKNTYREPVRTPRDVISRLLVSKAFWDGGVVPVLVRLRALQAYGKIRRFFRTYLYTKANERLLSKRKGECTRCGACCKILFRCPFLKEENDQYSCGIYGQHFNQCRIFPLVPQDLKELEQPCGFSFDPD